ncbi:hypothetical protein I317_00621 [Kwoniella heveanensis CBS 569]|nr:hypothetical protein I317_00621 [Kwoniella heveanensis CBS 569]
MRRRSFKTFAKYCPLVSAIVAPLSTLLDIPALTQHWYAQNGVTQSDPKASLILSAIGLALNVLANVLLIVRFSSKTTFWWRHSTRWSLISWIGKTVVAGVNLIIFGILTRNGDGYQYVEGFWCAVISIIEAGIISITLTFHYFFAFKSEKHDSSDIRSEGKKFMLSVTAFISILAVQSLVFSQIEGWLYSDGIYFSTQVALTIGYGDFAPTTTAGKVLIFPFSVLTISQLGNEIAQIINFMSGKAEKRREKWRKRYEKAMHREANKIRPEANLTEEMALIHQINSREELMSQMYDLMWSALSLIVFWLIGATIFSQIEGWPYGQVWTPLYSVMILSLTIGFGDYTPRQPAGKIVFIVYALMAVPIVTSFAVQTITGLLSTYSQRGAAKEAFMAEQKRSPEAFAPHSEFVLRYHESYSELRQRLLDSNKQDGETDERGGYAIKVGGNDQILREDGKPLDEGGDTSMSKQGSEGGGIAIPEDDEANDKVAERREKEEAEDQDPSDYTLTGRRKNPDGHWNKAERELTDDIDRTREAIRRKKEREEKREGVREEEHESKEFRDDRDQGEQSEEDDSDDGDGNQARLNPRPESARAPRSSGVRLREESEQTRIGNQAPPEEKDPARRGFRSEEKQRDTAGKGAIEREKQKLFQEESSERQLELDLLRHLLKRTIQLEAEARQMLLDSMDHGVARTLLLADRNVQIRDVRSIRGDDSDILSVWTGEVDKTRVDGPDRFKDIDSNPLTHDESSKNDTSPKETQTKGQLDMLGSVRRYRNTFAEILVVGSLLQKLDGEEKESFERLREEARVEEMKQGERTRGDKEGRELESKSRHQSQERTQKRDTRNETTRHLSDEENGEVQDIDKVADERWNGLTGRVWKRYVLRVREKDLTKWETV